MPARPSLSGSTGRVRPQVGRGQVRRRTPAKPCRRPSRPMLSQETRLSVEPLIVDPMGYFVTSSLRTGSTAVVPASILAIARPYSSPIPPARAPSVAPWAARRQKRSDPGNAPAKADPVAPDDESLTGRESKGDTDNTACCRERTHAGNQSLVLTARLRLLTAQALPFHRLSDCEASGYRDGKPCQPSTGTKTIVQRCGDRLRGRPEPNHRCR